MDGGGAIVPKVLMAYPRSVDPTPGAAELHPVTLRGTGLHGGHSETVWALTNAAVDGARACSVAYYKPGNLLFLYRDGNAAQPMPLSDAHTLENAPCRVWAEVSRLTSGGNTLAVNLNLLFNAIGTDESVEGRRRAAAAGGKARAGPSPDFSVRPKGASHQWRRIPPM